MNIQNKSCRSARKVVRLPEVIQKNTNVTERKSCRSIRKVTKINNNINNNSVNLPFDTLNNGVDCGVFCSSTNIYDKKNCRSVRKVAKVTNKPKKKSTSKDENEYIYNVVTKTPAGKDVTVPTSQNYGFKMSNSKSKVFQINKPKNKIKYLPYTGRKKYTFIQALDIYENNQSYYVNKIEKHPDRLETYIIDIEKMEKWFYNLHEPKPLDEDEEELQEWEERNKFKMHHKYTSYFDKELLQYMNYD